MPSKRRRVMRTPMIADLSAAVIDYLRTGLYSHLQGADFWEVFKHTLFDGAELGALWADVGATLLEQWIAEHPGSRPWAWWRLAAPRCQPTDLPPCCRDFGDAWLTRLERPRHRLGGVGTPSYEVVNQAPEFAFGLPISFVSAFDEQFCNGRAVDIDGRPIGTRHRAGAFAGRAIDPTDPPRYESQAAYLVRQGLLTDDERARLTAADFEAEVIEPDAEDDPDVCALYPHTFDKLVFDENRR
jgi:hypothetical protein